MFSKFVIIGLLGVSAIFFLAFAVAFSLLNPRVQYSSVLKTILEKLPRNRVVGCFFAVIALFWCYPNIIPLFDSSSPMQGLILPFLVGAAIIACIFADFLFARAFAGILILNAHTLLKWVYPLEPACYSLFAALVMSFGLLGIVLAAKPYWLRYWFQKAFDNGKLRIGSVFYFSILALSCILIAWECWK